MKFLYIILLLLITNLNFAQNLNIKFVEQIMRIPFLDIEKVMTDGYGFQKFEVGENGKMISFFKLPDDNIDNGITVKVLNSKLSLNVLHISIGQNFDIKKIKDDLMQNGYLYNGENEDSFWFYEKDRIIFIISQKKNSVGARQIITTYRE